MTKPLTSEQQTHPIGQFSIDDLTGAARYAIAIATPPLPRGPMPMLSLCYVSHEQESWRLVGIPTLRRRGEKYACDGNRITVRAANDGMLEHVAVNGSRMIFGQKLGGDRWQATRIEDIFGNYVDFSYADGRPDKISYGSSGEKARRSVAFGYTGDGFLAHIVTAVGDEAVRSYDLHREGRIVREVVVTGHGEAGDIAASAAFAYADGRLTTISEPSGLVTEISYSEIKSDGKTRSVAIGYCLKVRGFQGVEEYHFSHDYDGGQADLDHGWTFAEATEWDEATRIGRRVTFGKTAPLAGKVMRVATLAKTSGVRLAETAYLYETSPDDAFDPRLIKIEEIEFADNGQPLFTRSERMDYNTAGLPVRRQTDQTTEFYDYARIPGSTRDIYLPAGASLYAGQLEAPEEKQRLKGASVRYDFDDRERPHVPTAIHQQSWISSEAGLSETESSFLDNTGAPLRQINALGVATVIDYDSFHFPCKVVHTGKDGSSREEAYRTDPAHGGQLWSRDSAGFCRRTVFDAFGIAVEHWGIDLSKPDLWGDETKLIKLSTRKYRHDPKSGLAIREVLEGERRARDYMDALGRVVRTERKLEGGKWQVQLQAYDTRDRIGRQSLPWLFTTKTKSEPTPQWVDNSYDAYGRKISETFPDGRSILHEFMPNPMQGSLSVRRYAVKGLEKKLISQEVYERGNVIEQQKQPDTEPTRFKYDVLGRLVRQIAPTGTETRYVYDGLDRAVREENPTWGVRAFAYDKHGLLTRVDLNGLPITYDYDSFGRLTAKTVATDASGKTEPNIYRAKYLPAVDHPGERVIETLPGGHQVEIAFAPHGAERSRTVTLKDGPAFTLRREFYITGEEAASTYPNGVKMRRVYASSGMLQKVLWAENTPQRWGATGDCIVEYRGHDAYGRPQQTHCGNGVSEIRTADDLGQTVSLTIGRRAQGAPAYLRQNYSYDALGDGLLKETIDRSDANQSRAYRFGYDDARRLRTVEHSFPGKTDYIDYGVIGNVTKIARPSGLIDLIGANPYQCDDSGNVTAKQGKHQTWNNRFDADHRLLQCSIAKDGVSATTAFAYDMDGVRILKTDPDAVRTFYIADDYQVTLYPGGRALATIKVQGVDGAVACFTEEMASGNNTAPAEPALTVGGLEGDGRYAPGVVYLHYNNIGSTLLATDNTGAKIATVGFDATGRIDGEVSAGKYDFELYFSGMVYDPTTSFYYAGDRYYDPEGMRFLSPDRLRASSDPYGYASGDPINYFDWDGQCGICERLKKWWRKAKTCRTGSRLTRVFTAIVGVGGMTFTVLSGWFNTALITPANLVGTMVFMLSFSVANQTIDYITTGRHDRSCLSCLWDRICCCRAFCIANRTTVSLVVNTAVSAIFFPISYLLYNAFAGSSGVGWEVILWSVPRGVVAGILSSLTITGVYSSQLPMLRFASGSVFGSVFTELLAIELTYLAFTAGDIAVQVLFVPQQYFNFSFQGWFSRALLIIAPFTSRANPLVAILPISNIPWITSGPMMMEDGSFAPFWPCLCNVPPEEGDPENGGNNEENDIIVEEVNDENDNHNQPSDHESSHENGNNDQSSDS